MKTTQIEIPNIALKALKDQKSEALKVVQKIDDILKTLHAQNETKNPERKKRGSSARLDRVILNMRGEFDSAAALQELAKEKLIQNVDDKSEKSEMLNAFSRLIRAGKVNLVKSGRGRARATYKVNNQPKSVE